MGDDENACVRNIVKEIMRECIPKKIKVNKNFVTYLTKLLLIDPSWGIGDDFFSQRQNVQVFVKYVIDRQLRNQFEPSIVTLKLQFYFSCNLAQMDKMIQMDRRELNGRLTSLRDDIVACTKVDNKEDIDGLFRKIVFYVILSTGMGNPTRSKVFEEALVVLKSILDEDELKDFTTLSKHEKMNNLNQFSKIVAGIRLFNKDCEKGGEGIADLPDLLSKAICVIREGTEQTLLLIMEKVNALTTALEKCYVVVPSYKGYLMREVKSEFPEDALYQNSIAGHIKDLLILFRQYELLIRRILEELDRAQEESEVIFANMVKLLAVIHDTVYMKIAIPVGVVFPLFEELWGIWEKFQDQGLLLSRISMIMSNLEIYAKQTKYEHIAVEHLIGELPSMTDVERLSETAHLTLSSDNEEITVIRAESIKNIDHIELEYLGFCCWKLIHADGALIPGNPSMGIVVYKGKNYVFSCVEGFEEFAKDPQMYINYVLDLARRKPHLIDFFELREELEAVYNVGKLVQSKVEIRMCEDKVIQTISNNEESYIDVDYRWNIWDLKREALTMARISGATTKSTQTDKTGSKNSIRNQTYSTKHVEVQTMRESYTNVPKPSTFIYGLRGRKDNQQFKIDLTRPPNES